MLALICLLLSAPVLHARDVNKCVDAQGNIMLTDEPCSTLKSKPMPATPPKQPPATVAPSKPLPPILPPPEQQIPQAPAPAPAEKPTP
jgi:hypothetical protein